MMTDLERAQRIEAALQLRIGRLEFQIAVLEVELADVRAERDAVLTQAETPPHLRVVEPA